MQYAQKLRESNDQNWWKVHESCLLAVSSIKPFLQELLDANTLEFNLSAFVNQFVLACLHESSKILFYRIKSLIKFTNGNQF